MRSREQKFMLGQVMIKNAPMYTNLLALSDAPLRNAAAAAETAAIATGSPAFARLLIMEKLTNSWVRLPKNKLIKG